MPRRPSLVLLGVVIVAAVCSAAQRDAGPATGAEQLLGTWSGTWEGSGSGGGFELTLEREKEGPMTGRVSVPRRGRGRSARSQPATRSRAGAGK